MKILMIGLGSIGQRHLRNIKKLDCSDNEILAYRVRGLQRTFSDDLTIREGVSLEEEFNIKVFYDLNKALSEKPDIVFITNITSEHISCALTAARAGCDIFIEKPLSDNMDGIEELKKLVKNMNIILYIGYQNRFHPCIKDVQCLLPDIGKLISADNEFSERLSTMHSYEDYRNTYMARKEMGGGAVLNLQIHAFDYLQWLLGTPQTIYSVSGSNSDLEINVEDFASTIITIQTRDGNVIPVYSHTDFLQYPAKHVCRFIGNKGRIEIDLLNNITLEYIDGQLVKTINHKHFKRNDMFVDELQDFFKCVRLRENPQSDIDQGIIGLKMAILARKSAETGRVMTWEKPE